MTELPFRKLSGGVVRPHFAPHVVGTYSKREFEDGMPLEQKIVTRCTECGASWQGGCLSGQVKTHIFKFARIHLHRDPLKDPL